jgi:hypothetical protein
MSADVSKQIGMLDYGLKKQRRGDADAGQNL